MIFTLPYRWCTKLARRQVGSCMLNPLFSVGAMRDGASLPSDFLRMNVDELFWFVQYTFLVENAKDEDDMSHSDATLNYGVDSLDRQDIICGVAKYSSSKALLMEHLENEGIQLYSNARCGKQVQLRWLSVELNEGIRMCYDC